MTRSAKDIMEKLSLFSLLSLAAIFNLDLSFPPFSSLSQIRVLIRFCISLQRWRRQWVVLDIVAGSNRLTARIFGSHLHEDKSRPLVVIRINDVHALHRVQSRYAV